MQNPLLGSSKFLAFLANSSTDMVKENERERDKEREREREKEQEREGKRNKEREGERKVNSLVQM